MVGIGFFKFGFKFFFKLAILLIVQTRAGVIFALGVLEQLNTIATDMFFFRFSFELVILLIVQTMVGPFSALVVLEQLNTIATNMDLQLWNRRICSLLKFWILYLRE